MVYPPPAPAPTAPPRRTDTVGVILALLLFIWICVIAGLGSTIAWGGIGIARASGAEVSAFVWPVIQLALALAVLLAVGGLFLWRSGDAQSPFRLWLIGTLLFLVAAPLKLIALSQLQISALAQLVIAGAVAAGAVVAARRRASPPTPQATDIAIAVAVGLFMLIPWILWGTLGSPLDVLLALVVAALIGIGGAWLMAPLLAAQASPAPSLASVLYGGLSASTFLFLVGLALARDGQVLLLAIPLWAVGWLAEPLWRLGGKRALAVGIAAAAFGPLAFADPNELGVLLNFGSQDALVWLTRALTVSVIITLIAAAILAIAERWLARDRRVTTLGGYGLAGVGAVIALLGYLLMGRPGFYGDRLFILMSDQADLSAIPTSGPRDARLHATYDTLVAHADRTQGSLRGQLNIMGVDYQPYYLVNAIEVRGGLFHRLWFSMQPGVERVLDSPTLRPLPELPPVSVGDRSAAPVYSTWNLEMVGAPRVWEEFGVRGEGIVLGESDSGVQGDHPELADSYRDDEYSWFDPWNHTTEPTDIGGHGTHTTATVVGNTVGVAPDAEWFGCVNLARNLGNPALYLDCMQYMLAPFPPGGDPLRDGNPSRAAHVLNNSWGCPPEEGCDPTVLVAAVDALRHAGIFVVASAGNEGMAGCSTIADPIALYDSSFTVGAVDSNGQITSFSSLGPVTADGSNRIKPDIVAPGAGILSAYPGSTYEISDGTSMAGPHVAGVVALLWSAVPELVGDIDRTEEILTESATPYRGRAPRAGCGGIASVPNNIAGYGIINAYEAIKLARGER